MCCKHVVRDITMLESQTCGYMLETYQQEIGSYKHVTMSESIINIVTMPEVYNSVTIPVIKI